MNWRVLKIVCAIVFTSALLKPAFCQNYYIVVGAFATEKDDIKEFTSYLPGISTDTAYTINSSNRLLHLYVLKTTDKELAMSKASTLQKQIESKDDHLVNSLAKYKLPDETAIRENHELPISSGEYDQLQTGSSAVSALNASISGVPSNPVAPAKPKGKFFKFTITKPDGSEYPGEVHQIDPQRGRELATYTANAYVDVTKPGKNRPMALVCGVFGYKEINKYVDYSDPSGSEGARLDEQGAWVIPYRLERLETGDVSIMYNLAFYKDANVMLPHSKRNLDDLVNMMKANPDYVIKVHAHCNGRNSRKIIAASDKSDYFEVKGTTEKKGSAKELTSLRGEAVRRYLVNHGIEAVRVKIFSWGGNEMMVDENSPYAKLNDRIEIEILKD